MIKIYKYNAYKNNVRLTIPSGRVTGTLIFDQGNVATKECPTARVSSLFWQQAIESTNLFKEGVIRVVQTIKDNSDEDLPKAKDERTPITSVDSLDKAVDYLATNYGVQVKTRLQAFKEAKKFGIAFPNLPTD